AAITMLADPEALEEVVFGPGGLAEGLSPGSTLVDMSTVGPDAVRSVAERLGDAVEVLDAPVLGSIAAAESGSLKIFVGGSEEAFQRWSPVFEVLGTPFHLGPPGTGASMKLVVETAARLGLELRVAKAARSWLEQAEKQGLGEMDYSAVVAMITGGRASLPAGEEK